MEFSDLFELLEAVRIHPLAPKECLIPVDSLDGRTFGYVTADGHNPSTSWEMPLALAKATASARGTKEALYIRDLLTSFMGRRQLLIELRSGTLDYGVPVMSVVSQGPNPLMTLPFRQGTLLGL